MGNSNWLWIFAHEKKLAITWISEGFRSDSTFKTFPNTYQLRGLELGILIMLIVYRCSMTQRLHIIAYLLQFVMLDVE
jgi:hypothetical protein